MDTPIAKLIREARERVGLNQKELGDTIGVSRNHINMVEKGKSILDVAHAPALSKALSVPEPEIIGAIMATKYPGLRLAAQPMKRSGLWVDLTPIEQRRVEEHATQRGWRSPSLWARKALLSSLDAQEDKK